MSVALTSPSSTPAFITPDASTITPATLGDARVPVATIAQRNPTHKLFHQVWEDIDVLRQGGRVLQMQADRFLIKRPKEVADIYQVRLQNLKYQNLLGMGIAYYSSKLFENDPELDIKLNGQAIQEPDDADSKTAPAGDINAEAWNFYQETFLKDCDRAGTTFVDFMRQVVEDVLLFKTTYVLIDLPKTVQAGKTLKDQDIRPLLRKYDPRCAINWEVDGYGNLSWIVFEVNTYERPFLKPQVDVRKWYYFDTLQFYTYEWRSDQQQTGEEQMARLVEWGPHSMSDYKDPETGQIGCVPVIQVDVPPEQWIAMRVFFDLLDHLNLNNTYSWSLIMANLAMPVIITEGDYQPTLVEGGYILLPPGSEFHWTEPMGNSFKASETRLASLREEIFRMMHLQAQGKSSSASASQQSGYSKEQDMAPARDVLNRFGDLLRATMQSLLGMVGAIRKDTKIDFDVRGFDFTETDKLLDIEEAAAVEALNIPSETFRKERYKGVVRKYAKDWNPELVATIEKEVDDAPTQAELDQQQAEMDVQGINTSLQKSGQKLLTKGLQAE